MKNRMKNKTNTKKRNMNIDNKIKNNPQKKPGLETSQRHPIIGLKILPFILILVFLSLVLILRMLHHDPVFPGGESYYHLRIAESLHSEPLMLKDPVQGTAYTLNPYHYFIAFFLWIWPSLPALPLFIFIPLITGLLSSILFFRLLRRFGVKVDDAAYSLIILAVTPAFTVLFTGFYLAGFIILLAFLWFNLLLSNRWLTNIVGVLIAILLALTSLSGFLISLLIMLVIFLALKKTLVFKKKFVLLLFSLLASVIALFLMGFFVGRAPSLLGFHTFAFNDAFSLLKAPLGFDFFLLFIALIGFLTLWSKSDKTRFIHMAIMLMVIASFFNSILLAFASFAITFYCTAAILFLFKRKWELDIIKAGTILLLACSLVFSLTNQINILVMSQPDSALSDTLSFLRQLEQGNVLSAEENGFIVEFYSGQPVVLDANFRLAKNYYELRNDTNTLWMVQRLKQAEPLLAKHDIHYVLLTPAMKEDFWDAEEAGLWFVMRNSESFSLKYESLGVELWEFKGVPQDINNQINTQINNEINN